jgi:hypothetical protein
VRRIDEHLVADSEDRDRALPRELYDLVATVGIGVYRLVIKIQPVQFLLDPPAERAIRPRV